MDTGNGNGNGNDKVRRFSRGRIFEHGVHVATFAVLLCTGLSQTFFSLEGSQWVILHLGGIDNVRFIHRCAGVLVCFDVLAHLTVAAIGIGYWKWQPTMIITKKDFSDVIVNIRYYLNIENAPARAGRYNYKQKFEYWAILTSVLLMMFSGLILWFPMITTKFFPGEIIPAAKVLHTNQALVVSVIISVWHIYNAVFSPDVFPLDTSIFTGYISKDRMLRDHQEELVGVGREERENASAGNVTPVSVKKSEKKIL